MYRLIADRLDAVRRGLISRTRSNRAIVTILGLGVLLLVLPDGLRPVWPLVSFHDAVNQIAAKGEHVDLPATPYRSRIRVFVGFARRGEIVEAAVTDPRTGALVVKTLPGRTESLDERKFTLVCVREILALMFVGLGASLVLARPNVVSWMLYLFCLRAAASAPALALQAYLPAPLADLEEVFYDIVPAVGYVAALVFAARLHATKTNDWRDSCVAAAPWLFLVLAALGVVAEYGATWFGQTELSRVAQIGRQILEALVCIAAVAAMIVGTRVADARTRGWKSVVAAAFAFALAGLLLDEFDPPDYTFHSGLLMLSAFVIFAVAYSILRSDFLDIDGAAFRPIVVLGVALIAYTTASTFLEDRLKESVHSVGYSISISLAGTIVFATGLHVMWGYLEKRLDSLVKHRTIDARERATEVALNLPDAPTREAFSLQATSGIAKIFDLTSAAFHSISHESSASNESAETLEALRAHDAPHPLKLDDRLIVPIHIRGELAAYLAYGRPRDGEWEREDLDVFTIVGIACAAALYRFEADDLHLVPLGIEKHPRREARGKKRRG